MSSTSSNSVWNSANKKFKSKVDKIFHKYPKLPKTLPREDSLPLQIGSKVSVRDYNTFLIQNEKTGYKFHWEGDNVYIIDMANPEHEAVVSYLQDCFKEPNNGVKLGPIEVLGQPFHYNPTNNIEKMAPDIMVRGDTALLTQPLVSHPGPPPSDKRPHGRIMCEIASAQNVASWGTRCENWMHEQYIRCVFGVKLDDVRSFQGNVHRSMIAMLWTRRALAGSVLSTNATLAGNGVYVKQWDFGTLQYGTNTATGCNANNLNAYQVTIPVSDAFWDPPIVGGVPNVAEYAVTVPGTVLGNNFIIDLYDVQRVVLKTQKP
ncbi:4385_t:CDS:2 [Funneliformis caledonium]|uniref:4385_t:CDS:1 n=1 Tax=Funneliformis caledonium TaxID=1117310 RepID=A0A9N9ESW2_9GLOM|nr:4385_t:CDS:2 [Funneliformis caledonium]